MPFCHSIQSICFNFKKTVGHHCQKQSSTKRMSKLCLHVNKNNNF